MQKNRSLACVLPYLAMGVSAMMLTACASLGMGGTPEEVVAKRANDYWAARISGDKGKAYSYANAAYKLAVTQEGFSRQYPGTFAQSAKVKTVNCEQQKCEVGIALVVNAPIPGRKVSNIDMYSTQTWLLEDGQWWLYLQP